MVAEFSREIGNEWTEKKDKTEDWTLDASADGRREDVEVLGGDLGQLA